MLVDTDKNGNISIMEISKPDTFVITEALIRLSLNTNVSEFLQNRSKEIALLINHENKTDNDKLTKLQRFEKRQLKLFEK